jgi:hypothetical protein
MAAARALRINRGVQTKSSAVRERCWRSPIARPDLVRPR